jgi:aspartate/methionine/tyrosine aminotransferase
VNLRLAARTAAVQPFHVMEFLKHAQALTAQGRDIIHVSIGEPDFTAPPLVAQALAAAVARGDTTYTPALGIAPLREAIAGYYAQRFGLALDPGRVVVTAGASAALLLACTALVERDARVLMPDPSYPCNRHFVSVAEGEPQLVAAGPAERFQLTRAMVEAHWSARTAGVLLASPSNPTGTSIPPGELRGILDAVRQREGFAIVDEIYQGLSYDAPPSTALSLSEDVVVLNSFSKYFSMTGWRLGWLVVPDGLQPTIEKLAQNLFICPSAPAQHAALACFAPESLAIYEERRAAFKARRDYLVPALRLLGFGVPAVPDGAFYIYVDISRFSNDSERFAHDMLEEAGVCAVPGADFGNNQSERYLRISYATGLERLKEMVERVDGWLRRRA